MSNEQDEILDDGGLAERDEPRGPAWQRAHIILMVLVGVGLLAWLATGFYKVGVGEVALVERLGDYVRMPGGKAMPMEPGTHFGMPWPIDKVFRVEVQKIQAVEANSFNPKPMDNYQLKQEWANQQVPATFITAVLDPYLITADLNVIHMSLTMQYRIVDPEKYLGAVAEATGHSAEMREDLMRRLVENEMLAVISRLDVDEVLAMQAEDAGEDGKKTLVARQKLDVALRERFGPKPKDFKDGDRGGLGEEFGIVLQAVNITQTRPPQQTEPAFARVAQARAEMDTAIKNSEAIKARTISEAQTEKDRKKKAAEAYGQQVREKANGEADRFKLVWKQYLKDRAVTKYDLYQTALAEVTRNAKRIYFVEEGQLLYITIAPPEGVIAPEGGGGGGPGGGPPR